MSTTSSLFDAVRRIAAPWLRKFVLTARRQIDHHKNVSDRHVGSLMGLVLVVLIWQPRIAGAQEVMPDFYQEPGLQKNRDGLNQHLSEHIDPFTGALQLHHVDLHLPGNGGFDLDIARSYNSTSVDPLNTLAYSAIQGSSAGLGWTVHFGRVLKKTTNTSDLCSNLNALTIADNPTLELPDGGRQLLAFTGNTSPMALTTQRWRADCASSSTQGGLIVYSPNGIRYDMTQRVYVGTDTSSVYAWYTTRITDRNGNYADIGYAAPNSPEITNISASDGRQIAFTWYDSGLSTRRINTVSAHGATYSYSYQVAPGAMRRT